MILTIAYSSRDIRQALRQMKWIGWLSMQNGFSMKKERVLLVPSRSASRHSKHLQICGLASVIFGEARCYLPEGEHEVGWPGSPNWMFKQALFHVEQHFQDAMMFLEPDAIPLVKDWYDLIKSGWEIAQQQGKEFFGARVNHSVPHMTGVAVYGANWRKVAPMIEQADDREAWDTFASSQILPNARLTPIIEHVFRQRVPTNVAELAPEAVIFHQDKQGRLIFLLDQAYWSGQCDLHPHFTYSYLDSEEAVPMKYYRAINANRTVKANGLEFRFELCYQHAGTWIGVFATEKEEEQIALDALVQNPRNAVESITVEDWTKDAKKKPPTPTSLVSNPWPPQQVTIRATPSQSPAVLVGDSQSPDESGKSEGPSTMDEFIKVGPVIGHEGPPPPRRGRPKKHPSL